MNDTTPAEKTAAALRQAAEFLAAHAHLDIPIPEVYVRYNGFADEGRAELDWFLSVHFGEAEQPAAAAQIIKALGGKWDKKDFGQTLTYRQRIGALQLDVNVNRAAVCEAVVVGTEEVTIPAFEALPERVETREVIEWQCKPLLAQAAAAPEGAR